MGFAVPNTLLSVGLLATAPSGCTAWKCEDLLWKHCEKCWGQKPEGLEFGFGSPCSDAQYERKARENNYPAYPPEASCRHNRNDVDAGGTNLEEACRSLCDCM
eukprot:CAMPEP_0203848460 /NCGR_PEP_ID=MMETSP0359-20131031/5610_1 /ASSEMBLY_ACC=CAM_ASM_000338 /TAXON_ID=268821 /ORGANISM="Scrippsiella Hangoei, Strain SHTV-5" /LENGTH=102 /DNA_ID=CAMNT_0050764057 /DNA_START=216 /DNA_END=524 /DNA_ORIENTATION=+